MKSVASLLLLASSASSASAGSLGSLSVDGVQEKLADWGLEKAFGARFREAGVDGWALELFASKSNVEQLNRALYPDAEFFHFHKLQAKVLQETKASQQQLGSQRRNLAETKSTGIEIRSNGSYVAFGEAADVELARTGEEELTVSADAVVEGDLTVSGGDLIVDGDMYPFFPTLEQTRGIELDISVRSRGYDDACVDDGMYSNKCGSYIKVNGEETAIARGHAIMYLDENTGEVLGQGLWDTYYESDTSIDVKQEMIDFVANITDGRIVVIGVHDSAGNDEPFEELAEMLAYGAYNSYADFDLGFRDTMCLIGRKGSEKEGGYLPWQQLNTAARYYGPSDCQAVIQTGSYTAEVSGSYDVIASDFNWNGMPLSRNIWIRALSIGFDDPGYGCVYANGGCTGPNMKSSIWVNGENVISTGRGHNFAVINQVTGAVEATEKFDSHGDSDAGTDIETFVGNITQGRIVVLVLHDAAGNYEHGDSLLGLMAGHEFDADFELRESFCMIGRKGKVSVNWMTYYFNERFKGPSWCEAAIPMMPPAILSTYENYVNEGIHDFSS